MPCLKKMHVSLRSEVNGAKGRLGPSCSMALSVSFNDANWSKEGSPFGNTLKNDNNLQLSAIARSLGYSKQSLAFTIETQTCYF